MHSCPKKCCRPTKPIVCPTKRVVRDFFHRQTVPIIHPVKVINRHHCIPVPKHIHKIKVVNRCYPVPKYVYQRLRKSCRSGSCSPSSVLKKLGY